MTVVSWKRTEGRTGTKSIETIALPLLPFPFIVSVGLLQACELSNTTKAAATASALGFCALSINLPNPWTGPVTFISKFSLFDTTGMIRQFALLFLSDYREFGEQRASTS
jgi:hypothetical protein